MSKQSGALITKDGSRQERADIPRFAAPPEDAHRARISILAPFNGLAAAPTVDRLSSIGVIDHCADFSFCLCVTSAPTPTLKSLPSIHMRCRMPASLRGTATIAHSMLDRVLLRVPSRRRGLLCEAAASLLLRVRKWSALRAWGLRVAQRIIDPDLERKCCNSSSSTNGRASDTSKAAVFVLPPVKVALLIPCLRHTLVVLELRARSDQKILKHVHAFHAYFSGSGT